MTGGMLPAEQIDAKSCPEDVFGEVLGVTPDVALAMWMFFHGRGPATIEQIQGMTPQLAAELRRCFRMKDSRPPATPFAI
jgi:hypothetical protein